MPPSVTGIMAEASAKVSQEAACIGGVQQGKVPGHRAQWDPGAKLPGATQGSLPPANFVQVT